MKTLLINPPPEQLRERHDRPDFPHLGLGYIAAYLLSQGIHCEVIDAKMEGINLAQLEERLTAARPDLVGVTAMTHGVMGAARTAQLAKRVLPSCITVLGGPHATALPEQTLQEFGSLDIVVAGEGEITLLEIVQRLEGGGDLDGLAGLCYRRDGQVRVGPTREPLEDLDAIPFPAWELFPRAKKYPMMTARGCPFHCNFCMRMMGSLVRKRSVQSVLAELVRNVDQFQAQFIDFFDETFAVDRKYAMELLDLMIQEKLPEQLQWSAETRADLADLNLFRKMKAAGCHFLGFGIESGNKEILKATGKGITLEQVERAVILAKQASLRTGSFFILGHPNETQATIRETINLAVKLNTDRVAFGIMVPYPGTAVYGMAKKGEGGYRMISADWSDFNKQVGNSLELQCLPRRQLERLQLMAYLSFYLHNHRLIDLVRLLVKERRIITTVLKKMILGRN